MLLADSSPRPTPSDDPLRYGAHGSSRTRAFNPLQLAWVEAGGVYAIASVRGGGEEGEAWHRAGMRENKQNTFADFHAAGDYLVDQGWTTRGRLGIHGGSAGGQLVGVALTQRPEAYAAVLCSARQLDMVRAELSGSAALWPGERGTVRLESLGLGLAEVGLDGRDDEGVVVGLGEAGDGDGADGAGAGE